MTPEEKMDDPVNHPCHYTSGKKNPEKTTEDLRKAVWYINRYIDLLEKEYVK